MDVFMHNYREYTNQIVIFMMKNDESSRGRTRESTKCRYLQERTQEDLCDGVGEDGNSHYSEFYTGDRICKRKVDILQICNIFYR